MLVLAGVVTAMSAPAATAAVRDIAITDAAPRGFSIVWVSDESVVSAGVRVFTGANGTGEITGTLTISLVSAAFPPALAHGVVKVSVTGVNPNTTVYVQTVTTGAGGTVESPAAPPFLAAQTPAETTVLDAANQLRVNDVIRHDVFLPDGVTPAAGALLVVDAPGLGAYPLTAFVGEGMPVPTAAVDLNNLFSTATGKNVTVPAGQVLRLTEFRGLACAGLVSHQLVRYRRAPAHEETPAIVELELPVHCHFADVRCDGTIDALDAQRVLDADDSRAGQCRFNADLDAVADGAIDVLDAQRVLNHFGENVP